MTRPRWLAVALFVAGACGDDHQAIVAPPAPPAIAGAVVTANPDNVLSAVVSVRVANTDSVIVHFHAAAAATGGDSATPASPVVADSFDVPVLGLLPGQRYVLRAVAYGPGGTAVGDSLSFTTGPLPTDIPAYSAGGDAPGPGFVVFGAGQFGVVIDNTGRVVWYHRFPNGPGLNFQPQPTGRYVARPTTPDPADRDLWVEIDPLGRTERTLGCARNLEPRFHDLIAEPDGSYWVMCDEPRIMDLSSVGGVPSAVVTGTVVQHMSATGGLLFEWSAFDHFAITDLDSASRVGPTVNWTHGNALDLDADGNLVVSFRSLSEITKIDTRTGAVLWRMGGSRNEFSFDGGAWPPFLHQHGVRLTQRGSITLLDNLGDPAGSRAERYAVDAAGRTARLVDSVGPTPSLTAQLGGATQTLPGGHTLVAYGNAARLEEYDSAGNVVWRIQAGAGYIFRAERIRSLYRPGVGSPR